MTQNPAPLPPISAPVRLPQDGPDSCLHRWFEAQVARTPRAIAVASEAGALTWAELNRRANRLAHALRARGVGPGALAGVCVERSPEMVVALLGVLKAGAAYVPMDPTYPAERLAFMLGDAQAAVLLTQAHLRDTLPPHPVTITLDVDWPEIERHNDDNFICGATPDDLAYVIYTSGSTGTPKGVPIAHASVCNNLRWRQETFPLTANDRLLQTYSFSFDPSVWAFFWPLVTGARCVLPPPHASGDTGYLVNKIIADEISVLGFSPSMLGTLLDEPEIARCRTLRHVFSGGEALSGALVRRFHSLLPGADLHNVYGPTEATIDAAWWTCRRDGEGDSVPIGHPLPRTKAFLIGEDGQQVSDGALGELCLSGVNLSPGYLNRSELSADKFISNPFGPGRLYRTGDLCRRRDDGALEYLDRIDRQVKIRGFRIELGEIEAALHALSAVKDAAVLACEDRPGDKRLTAYVVPMGQVTASELSDTLAATLPAHMVPSGWVFLAALPLTSNGKVDHRALPAPAAPQTRLHARTAPATDTQRTLAAIWVDVLGVNDIGLEDHFFELGGHSLQAARVASRARAALGIDLAVRTLFERPTLLELSEHVEAARPAGTPKPDSTLPRVPRLGELSASFSQQRLWLFEQWQPGTAVYNIPLGLKLQGAVRPAVLRECLDEIIRRHEPLRTIFVAQDGRTVQQILPPAAVPLTTVDVTSFPAAERESEAQRLAVAEAQRPFDLTRDQMLRALLLRLGTDEHWLVLTVHHIASDGWSVGLLLDEFAALYDAFAAGQPSPLPELRAQYTDWASWQREWLSGDVQQAQMDFWRRTLAGAPSAQDIPTDRPRPAQQTFQGARLPVRIPAAVGDGLRSLCRAEGASLFMAVTAGLNAVLARWSGQHDIVLGTPVAGRSRVETEALVGFFVNTLALRTDLTGDPTGREIVRRVREAALNAFGNTDVPFDQVVETLQPQRDPSRNPFFQTLFALQNTPQAARRIGGLRVESFDIDNGTSKFDLTLNLWEEADGGLCGWWEYNTTLFDTSTVVRMGAHLETLLDGLGRDADVALSRLPLLSEAERRQVVVDFNRTARPYPRDETIASLFQAQAQRSPQATALLWQTGRMSYQELAERANGLAAHLQAIGVGPGSLVGICAERSPALIIGLLGILKAGGAYLPLDPTYPAERLALMLEDSKPQALLVQERLRASLPDSVPVVTLDQVWPRCEVAPTSAAQAESPAYVMYTSGSTGRPKAVPVLQRGVVRLVRGTDYASLLPDEVFLQLAPISFDASTFEIWGSLLNGACLALFAPHSPSLEELGTALKEFGVSTLWLTAGLFSLMVDERLDDLRGVRQLLAGGDVLPLPQVRRVLRELPSCRLINGYGPTESTTFACCQTVQEADLVGGSVPIGRPIANTVAYVLDPAGQPVPLGVPGELLLGGDGLSPGYLYRPELTAERFVANPFGDGRLYRTGDLTRWRPDGTLEFLGRLDNQVKVRGFRIELGEVEAALLHIPDVREAVVVALGDASGDKTLAAYVVPAEKSAPLSTALLRETLASRLPAYMVPSSFTLLPALPLTSNGKVDRRALPPPVPARAEAVREPAVPVNEVQAQIVALWEELLPNRVIGIHDDFFDIGGHSLLAVRMIHRLEQISGRKIPLATLFQDATVAHLARTIERQDSDARTTVPEPVVAFHEHGTKPPFFFLHGDFGGGFFCVDLARHLGDDQPLYVLPPHGVGGGEIPATIETMATDYLPRLRAIQPHGPYHLGGFCNGGLVAYEIAHQLQAAGEKVNLLALVDVESINTGSKKLLHSIMHVYARRRRMDPETRLAAFIRLQERMIPLDIALKRGRLLLQRVFRPRSRRTLPAVTGAEAMAQEIQQQYFGVLGRYITRRYPGKITLIWSKEGWDTAHGDPVGTWQEIADEMEYYDVPGSHFDCLTTHVPVLAARLRACLKQATTEVTS